MGNIERYLRLSAVTGLTGKRWLEAAITLNKTEDASLTFKAAGLSEQQIHQFYHLSSRQIAATEAWLAENDAHHLVTALDDG